MRKKILALVLALSFVLSSSAFAYRWVGDGENWIVYDENSGKQLKNTLIDVGDGVYYLDNQGYMVTGWWQNYDTGKYYFFDNNPNGQYGCMVFGLHMIDGYYFYFGNDGSLQTSDANGSYKKVYLDFWADVNGCLYNNNQILRDVSTKKSDYYTDPVYYTNVNFNNYFLANFGNAVIPKPVNKSTKIEQTSGGSRVITNQANFDVVREDGTKKSSATNASGGANYTVDAYGKIIAPDETGIISNKEIYGPANIGR